MQIILRNLMEDYVILMLDQVIDQMDGCKCSQCRLDMASYALNRLSPKYVVTTQGELMTRLCEFDTQFETNVMAEIAKAHNVISKKPHHPIGQPVD